MENVDFFFPMPQVQESLYYSLPTLFLPQEYAFGDDATSVERNLNMEPLLA